MVGSAGEQGAAFGAPFHFEPPGAAATGRRHLRYKSALASRRITSLYPSPGSLSSRSRSTNARGFCSGASFRWWRHGSLCIA